jgi:hypothetical protein
MLCAAGIGGEVHGYGAGWTLLGGSPDFDAPIRCLAVYGNQLVAGGDFSGYLKVLDAQSGNWLTLGTGLDGPVYALAIYGQDLIAAGSFTSAGSIPAAGIARWNGLDWDGLGSGLSGSHGGIGTALGIYTDYLFCSGEFQQAGGHNSLCFARWDDKRTTAGAPTPAGTGVTSPLGADVSVIFDEVTTGGVTSIDVQQYSGDITGFVILPMGNAVQYDIATTADFAGNYEISIHYDDTGILGSEWSLVLFHYDPNTIPAEWLDITTEVDTVTNVIRGIGSSFSSFAVGVQGYTTDIVDSHLTLALKLGPAIPNPIQWKTSLHFWLAEAGQTDVAIYDTRGRLVRRLWEGHLHAGEHRLQWHGEDDSGRWVGSGIYFARLQSRGQSSILKLVVMQ